LLLPALLLGSLPTLPVI